MKTLTFALDVQLNDQEDWIPEGTKVEVSSNDFYLNRYKGSTPVIITEAYTFKGEKITDMYYTEWFSNESFIELRRD